jgi:hypothetical protein
MRLLLDVRHASSSTPGVCHGPVDGHCPLLDGEPCSLLDEADGIVFSFDLDDETNRKVLARYRALRPDLPIYVITSAELAAQWSPDLAGVTVATREEDIAALLARVDQT